MSSRWLFRQGELILGPLDQEQLAQKILDGELSEETEAKELEGESFAALCDIEVFAVALAKAKAKRRVEVLSVQKAAAKRRRRLMTATVVGIFLLLISWAVFSAGTHYAKNKPAEPTDSLAFADLSFDVPSIRRPEKVPPKKDTLLSYREDNKTVGGTVRRTPTATGKGAAAFVDDVTVDIQWNPDSIRQVLNANQNKLLSCLQHNVKMADGWEKGELVKIPFWFSITNSGQVSKLQVEHHRYKGKTLQDCMLEEMGKWKFAPYDGAQAVVDWSISWKVRN